MTSAQAFAESAVRAEAAGWTQGLRPCSPLLSQDPYVGLAFAAERTSTLEIGTLLDSPVVRHPSVLASSIATVARLAPGRTHMGLGVGDTAVRLNGLAPASVAGLRAATETVIALLAGEALDVGGQRPVRLSHATSVPVWIAAQGPRTLRMAGAVADGVWIRVGTHPANLRAAWEAVVAGARDAGRDPGDVRLGLIFHTAVTSDRREAALMSKALAAGYYEYSRFLFDAPGFEWNGPDVHELQAQVWPDFHHHRDLVAAGEVVDFLSAEVGGGFALAGDWDRIAEQLQGILELGLPVDYVLPHPCLPPGSRIDFLEDAARQLLPRFA